MKCKTLDICFKCSLSILILFSRSKDFKFSNNITLKDDMFSRDDFEIILCHYNLSNNDESFQQLWTTLSSQ